MAHVTIYTSSTCAPCKVAKNRMKAAGVEFVEVILDQEPEALAALKRRLERDTINTPTMEFRHVYYDMTTFRDMLEEVAKHA